jgi:predicted nucleotidyltransferase component of viral defense system
MNEKALKDRLKVIAQERKIDFNQLWRLFLLERFLFRLSKSKVQDRFVFKGGLLLSCYMKIGRETVDADFLAKKLKLQTQELKAAIEEVLSVKVDDGILFSWAGTEKLEQPHMESPGIRVILDVRFHKMKDKISLDIGTGDPVEEIENTIEPVLYKGKPLFSGEITLLCYPIESICSEKLESIFSKGAQNSRMKDYHDVLLIFRDAKILDSKKLKKSIEKTFEFRATVFNPPISFDDAGIELLNKQWTNHLRNVKRFKDEFKLPDNIKDVLSEINTWLLNKHSD